jgi:hypothetical protein
MTTSPRTAPARSVGPLAAAWLVTGLVVGPVGWLLFALSESAPARVLGAALAVSAVLAVSLAVALRAGGAGQPLSLALSAVLVGLGVVGVAVLAADDPVFTSDVLLVGAPPVVGGAVTALLARRWGRS